jgi:hypothetical protein
MRKSIKGVEDPKEANQKDKRREEAGRKEARRKV